MKKPGKCVIWDHVKFSQGKKKARGWKEKRWMAQQLRAFTVLGEDSGPVPSIHIKHFRTTCNLLK